MKIPVIIPVVLVLTVCASAEMERKAITTDNGLQLFWWPILPQVKGWEQDKTASEGYGVNALVPKGESFSDSETIMYAKAHYKPQDPECDSLEELMKNDQGHFKEEDPSIHIKQLDDISDGDGKKLKAFEFAPEKEGNWEVVAYGEEGDYYLIFTMSSRKESGYRTNLQTFKELLSNYKEKLGADSEKKAAEAGPDRPAKKQTD